MMHEFPIGYDKIAHFFFYTVIAFSLGLMVLSVSSHFFAIKGIYFLYLTLSFISTIEEYRQYLFPNRSMEFYDGVANFSGICLGLSIPFLIAIVRRKGVAPLRLKLSYFLHLLILVPLFYGLKLFGV